MKKLLYILTAPLRWVAAPFAWLWRQGRKLTGFFTAVPEDVPLTDTLGKAFESRDAFMLILQGMGEHIGVLRRHLFRALIILAVTTFFSFTFSQQLMAILAVPLGENAQAQMLGLFRLPPLEALNQFLSLGADGLSKMQVIEPTEGIGIFMRVALLSGLALAMPWIVFEIYLFIWPGLMPDERRNLLIAIPAASLLFLAGIAFTYLVMLPAAVPFLYNFAGFRAAWRPAAYFGLATGLMFWIGVAFQMPLIIYVLAALGWIKARQLAQHWRIAIVVIAILAAAVTPTVDPVNMGLVMLPMILLYGFSIVGAVVAEGGRHRRQSAAA